MKKSFNEIFRQGFIIGIGMLIPLSVVFLLSNIANYKMSSYFYSSESFESSFENKEEEKINKIEVVSFHDVREDNFVMVLGSIKNTGNKKISSIKLEAEFYNEKGEFVYEESEYISKTLSPNEVENFAIKCGCNNRKFPEYSKVNVRVVGASGY